MDNKNPWTLKGDIYNVLSRRSGNFTKEIAEWIGKDFAESLSRQLIETPDSGGRLRISSLGTPCKRKLWYSVNQPDTASPLEPTTRNKFIFGDFIESYTLGLCMAAGHEVTGLQDPVDVFGIKGRRDCIISGMLFDIKSASTRSMSKFRDNGLRSDDPFGYLSQLSSYLHGSLSDPRLKYHTKAGFIAVDKQYGNIEVDIYDLHEELDFKELEVKSVKDAVAGEIPPRPKWENWQYNRNLRARELVEKEEDWADGKSGNRRLSTQCQYCGFKFECWPDLQIYKGSGDDNYKYLTKVVREPNMERIK